MKFKVTVYIEELLVLVPSRYITRFMSKNGKNGAVMIMQNSVRIINEVARPEMFYTVPANEN